MFIELEKQSLNSYENIKYPRQPKFQVFLSTKAEITKPKGWNVYHIPPKVTSFFYPDRFLSYQVTVLILS